MIRKTIFLLLVILLFRLGITGLSITNRIKNFSLSNGIVFVLLERPGTKTFAGIAGLNVGSGCEGEKEKGLAHLLEHLCCGITPTSNLTGSKNDAIERIYALKGGQDINAVTDADTTQYYVRLPVESLELWFQVESTRLKEMPLKNLERERAVVLEEWRQTIENNPTGRLFETFLKQTFGTGSYGHPPIGYEEDLNRISKSEIMHFHKRHYVPENMIIVLVGDVREKEIKKLASIYFGDIPASKAAPRPVTVSPALGKEKRIIIREDTEPHILIGFKVPAYPSKEHIVMTMILEILSGTDSSRLDRDLAAKRKMVTQLYCYMDFPGGHDTSLMVLDIVPNTTATMDQIESAVYKHLKDLQVKPIPEREIQKALAQYEARQYKNLEGNLMIARNIFEGAAVHREPAALFDKIEQLRKVTAADILETARRIFKKENRTVAAILAKKPCGEEK